MFYELLRLYREQVESLSLENYEVKKIGKGEEKIVYKGKDFFNWHKKDLKKRMYKQIIDKIYRDITKEDKVIFEVNKKELTEEDLKRKITEVMSENKGIHKYNNNRIRELYIDFYVENRDKIAPYFRTLYRILDLIHTSPLLGDSEDEKQAYSKILRAQLTESELFFLRYNAKYIMYGENLIKYINHYNILKHLPVFELLNFQIFRNDKNNSKDEERVNEIFYERVNEIFYKVCKALREGQDGYLDFDSEKYKIKIEGKEGDTEIKIIYEIHKKGKKRLDDEYFIAFERIRKYKKGVLFEYFMEEIFKDSNFREYNEGADISVELLRCNNTTYVISTIKSDKPIQIKYNHEKEEKVN